MDKVQDHYHPFLFLLMALVAMAELGLTAFLISVGNEISWWSSSRYHALLILLCFNSCWTTLFATTYMLWTVDGGAHFLASVASSFFWLLLTSILWGVASGLMFRTRTGGNCEWEAPLSRCRQSLTVMALGWTEFGLCMITLALTALWMFKSRRRKPPHSVRIV